MTETIYRKVSAIIEADWYPYHENEWFTHTDICAYFQWDDPEIRKSVSKKLYHESTVTNKLEKNNRAFRLVDRTLEEIDWDSADPSQVYTIKMPYDAVSGQGFPFEHNIFIPPRGLIVIAGVSNAGKGHPVGTPILTLGGWKNIEHLQLKEDIFGQDGQRHSLIGIFPRGKQTCYRFTFTDKSSVEVDGDHLWTIRKRWGRKTYNWLTKSTKEIIDLYGYFGKYNKNRIEIPICEPLNFPREGVPLSPYLLGLLLGDGKLGSGTPTFSTAEKELLSEFTRQGFGVSQRSKYDYGISGIIDIVRSLEIDKGSRDKFVPSLYKFNAKEIRLALLRGLMDTDGYISKRGWCEFTSISKQLAEDVRFLVQSLGGRVSFSTKAFNKYTYKGESRLGQKSYRVGFMIDSNPFALPRKAENWKAPSKPRNRAIKHIEPIGEFETICIQTDANDGLYLTKDCIVTHNTTFLLNVMLRNMDDFRTVYYTSELSAVALKRRLIPFEEWYELRNGNGKPKFKIVDRGDNFHDAVESNPDGLNIVDYLDVNNEAEYFKIKPHLKRIKKALRNGVAVVALQKPPGREDAYGGSNLRGDADLYLAMDFGYITVVKAKDYMPPDPNHARYSFEIEYGGSMFTKITYAPKEG